MTNLIIIVAALSVAYFFLGSASKKNKEKAMGRAKICPLCEERFHVDETECPLCNEPLPELETVKE